MIRDVFACPRENEALFNSPFRHDRTATVAVVASAGTHSQLQSQERVRFPDVSNRPATVCVSTTSIAPEAEPAKQATKATDSAPKDRHNLCM